MDEQFDVAITADTRPFELALDNLRSLAGSFGTQLTGALRTAAVSGRSLDDILRRVALNLAGMALGQGMAPLQNLASGFLSGAVGALSKALPFEKGGVPGRIVPFADGGIVSEPTYFGFGRGLGLMGEAGAEAILPLARGPDGRLGVSSPGGGAPVNITFNVTATDATSFRKSEAQISGMLARAVGRGMRTL